MPITADKSMIAIGGRDLPFTLTSDIAIRKTNMQVPITSKDIGSLPSTLDIPKSVESTKLTNTAASSPVTVERTYENVYCTAGRFMKFARARTMIVMMTTDGKVTPNVAQIAPRRLCPTPMPDVTDTPV